MCEMLVTGNEKKEELAFIIYNIAFSELNGRFTVESVFQKLSQHKVNENIKVEKRKLERLFQQWEYRGMIFDNATEYVVNTINYNSF